MKSEIKIRNRRGAAIIDIEGVIGVPEGVQFEKPEQRVATYEKFTDALARIEALDAAQVVVNIRSTGGDVNDALLIYEALRSLPGRVTTRCYGYVASAATIIAQAASPTERELSSSTLYLIHCSEGTAEGNSASISMTMALLDATDSRIADIYASASGRPAEEFAALMSENDGKGRWLSATEALEAGLADRLTAPRRTTDHATPEGLSLEEVFEVLGIPAPPTTTGEAATAGWMKRLAVIWRRIGTTLSGKGTSSGNGEDTSPGNGKPVSDAGEPEAAMSVPAHSAQTTPTEAVTNLVEADDRKIPDMLSRQSKARATEIKQCEDPSTVEYAHSANEAAYAEDARNMFDR